MSTTTRTTETDASIADLLGGGIIELVDAELRAVADNIMDPNTSPTAARKVTLVLTLKPNEHRDVVQTQIAVTSKMAPVKPQSTTLFAARGIGGASLTEANTKQPSLFEGATVTHEDGVTTINVKKAKG